MNSFSLAVLVSVPLGILAYRVVRDMDLTPLRIPLSILGLILLLALFRFPLGYDLYAYYTIDPFNPYGPAAAGLQGQGVFRYSPPIALLFAPLALLPWPVVVVGWMGLQLLALWYIGRGWALVLVLFPPVWADLAWGNINIFIAAVIVAGFRRPELWAFTLLTKVTPGVGSLWFAFRAEWRALLRLCTTVGLSVLVSIAIQGPGVWDAWFTVLRASAQDVGVGAIPIPLVPRLGVAVGLLWWGAARSAPWTVVVATTLAMPVLWPIAFAPLVAWVGLELRARAGTLDLGPRPLTAP